MSNRSGVGAKVELRAGSLRQKLETYAAAPAPRPRRRRLRPGRRDRRRRRARALALGHRCRPSSPRRRGHRGARDGRHQGAGPQAVVLPLPLRVERPRASRFVTDFMGGGEMGYWHGPGHLQPARPRRIRPPDATTSSRPRDGPLRAARHQRAGGGAVRGPPVACWPWRIPADVEVFPDEGAALTSARVSACSPCGSRASGRAAMDDRRAVTWLGRAAPPGPHLRRRLPAAAHPRLRRGARARPRPGTARRARTRCCCSRAGRTTRSPATTWPPTRPAWRMAPPRLEVEDAAGAWRTVVEEVGIPVGRPQTVLVPMKGRWRGPSRRVRIVTNMRIYWDQAAVGRAVRARPARRALLEPARADLRERGFSAEVTPDGREPFTYDYARVGSRLALEGVPRPLHARGRRAASCWPRWTTCSCSRRPATRWRLSFDASGAAAAARGLDADVPAPRRRLQQGDGHPLRHAATRSAAAVPRHARLPVRARRPPIPMTPERHAA